MSLPTIIAILIVGVLMVWRLSTRVEIELTASHAQFTVAPAGSKLVSVLGPVTVASLTVEKFAAIDFEHEGLEVTASDALEVPSGASAWKRIANDRSRARLIPTDDRVNAAVTFEPAGGQGLSVGRLEAVRASSGSAVTLESRGKGARRVTFRVHGGSPEAIVTLPAIVNVFADHVAIAGNKPYVPTTGSVVYRARVRPDGPLAEVTGAGKALVLSFDLLHANGNLEPMLPEAGIPVAALDFTELSDLGTRISAVRGEGHIAYPDHPEIAHVPIRPREIVALGALKKFYVSQIRTDSTNGWMRLHLAGTAEHVVTSAGEISKDRRLTAFDVLWRSPTLAVLFSIIVWAFPTTLGARRVYNDLKLK